MTSQPTRPAFGRRRSSVRFDTNNDAPVAGQSRPASPALSDAYSETQTHVEDPEPPKPTFSNPWGNNPAQQAPALERPRMSVGGPPSKFSVDATNAARNSVPAPPDVYTSGQFPPPPGPPPGLRPSIDSLPRYLYRENTARNRSLSQPMFPGQSARRMHPPPIPTVDQVADTSPPDAVPPPPQDAWGVRAFLNTLSSNMTTEYYEEETPEKPGLMTPDEKQGYDLGALEAQVDRVRRGRRMSESDPKLWQLEDGRDGNGTTEWSDYDDDEDNQNELDPEDPLANSKVRYDNKGRPIATPKKASRKHVESQRANTRCIVFFAKCLLVVGAPSHRIEAMLISMDRELRTKAHFIHFPGIIVASFGDPHSQYNSIRFIKANGGTDLGRIQDTHTIYRALLHDEISAKEATQGFEEIINRKSLYGAKCRILFAFGCASAICPLAFGGSFADMWVAGFLSCIMTVINIKYAVDNPIMANIFELVMAVVVSAIARAVSSINDSQVFCYQAVASGGVVLILPGFLILSSALELANKQMLTGSIKLVYTITYTLFLAFCLTSGSDLFYIIDPVARRAQDKATAVLAAVETISGAFNATGPAMVATAAASVTATASAATSTPTSWNGSFTFSNSSAINSYNSKLVNGCLRDPSWPWYAQPLPGWTEFILVPTFSILISLNNMQPIRTWQHRKHFVAMVLISIASFLANKYANKYAFSQSEIITTVGAFVVGLCGALYSRFFRGTGFAVSVTGVLFLVPSGLSAAGGLADTYRGTNNDYFSASLKVASRMIQVGNGITIGLLFAGLLIYCFGGKKKTAPLFF